MASVPEPRATPQTVNERLRQTCADYPHNPAFATLDENGQWRFIGWQEFADATREVAQALVELGLRKGDRFGILAATSLEWELAHLAALSLGAIVVGLDVNDPPDRLQQIADNADLNAILVGDSAYLDRLAPEQARALKFALALKIGDDCAAPTRVVAWSAARAVPNVAPAPAEVLPSDAATLIYTSGTTGVPKGILYSHAQIMLACSAIARAYASVPIGSHFLCWLPLSNLFQRNANIGSMIVGGCSYLLADPRRVMDVVASVEPTVFIGVPRFYELLASGIERNIATRFFLLRWLIRLAIAVGDRRARHLRAASTVPAWLRWAHTGADALILRRLRAVMGTRIRFLVSGSAAMAPRLLESFHAIGLLVLEAYGLSENIVPMAMNTPEAYRFGSVGRVLPENEVTLKAPDGEVLVRGAGVAASYYREPAGGMAMVDGFYDTGDFGVIDGDGFLTLKGRRSDLIKTSTGRRIAPAKVEAALQQIAYVDQAIVLGQDRPYVVALLSVDGKTAPDAELSDAIRRDVAQAVGALSAYERPRGFLILRHRFSIEDGELTSNLKLRRGAIARRYEQWVNEFYAVPATDSPALRFITEAQLPKALR